jgi:hypothetical protein
MVLTILSKLGPEYSVFVSTFHSVRLASGATWKMTSLEVFIVFDAREEQAHQHGNNQRPKGAFTCCARW